MFNLTWYLFDDVSIYIYFLPSDLSDTIYYGLVYRFRHRSKIKPTSSRVFSEDKVQDRVTILTRSTHDS